jgi:hypothetical protein
MRRWGFARRSLAIIAAFALVFPGVTNASGGGSSQEPQHAALGSLNAVGEVYVNNSQTPTDSTIFAGDTLRTGPNALATFTGSGNGSFEILPESELVFTGNEHYIAELNAGTVVMSSLAGPQSVNLRTGNYVAVAVTEGEQSTSKIEKLPDGSFQVSCTDGSVILVPLEGTNGLLIQAGQTVNVGASGKLSAVKETAAPATPTEPPAPPTTKPTSSGGGNNKTLWVVLALAGAGGAGIAIALGSHKSSSSVSPSTR